MAYNQVQSFQINDFANHYMDIEISGYRVQYSESIAGRGIARLMSWFGTAEPVDCFTRVSEEYIDLFQFLLVGYRPPLAIYVPETRNSTNFKILEVYSCDHACHIYFSSLSTSTHEVNLLEVTKNNLRSSGLLFIARFIVKFIVQTFIIPYQKK